MTSKVRIGFIGVGNMGQAAHLRNYVNLPDVEVAAIAELRPRLRKLVAARYGVERSYASAEEMLARERFDGIVAAQHFSRHGSLVAPLYSANVPIFTEKPLASSVEVGERMLGMLRDSGSWHMLGYHKRSDPATMYAKAEIERLKASGELGALRYARITMPAGDWVASGFSDLIQTDETILETPADPPSPGMTDAEFGDYVSFVNYYIHQVNLMRHLLGEPYRVTHADPSGVVLTVRSASGVAGTIEMSPYTTTIDWHESALVAFEHGYVRLDLPAPLSHNRPGRVEILRDPGHGETPETVCPTLPWVHAMRQQAINFVRAIRGEIAPMCDAVEALEDLRVAREYMTVKEKS